MSPLLVLGVLALAVPGSAPALAPTAGKATVKTRALGPAPGRSSAPAVAAVATTMPPATDAAATAPIVATPNPATSGASGAPSADATTAEATGQSFHGATSPHTDATAPASSERDWLTAPAQPGAGASSAARWPLVAATLLLLAAGGAFVALRTRGGQSLWASGASGHAIDILAIKSLGHKHRLVLVEAAGERLLLAATDRDVRLLSHIASNEADALEVEADSGQVAALTRSMGQRPAYASTAAAAAAAATAAALPMAPRVEAAESASTPYAAVEATSMPLHHVVPPAPGGSLSAEALYEGAARSMDLDDPDDEPEESPTPVPGGDAIGSDVAGLARWRQAAAQGADPWGKQL